MVKERVTIYVRLLGEGTPVARPVEALRISANEFQLLRTSDYDPDDEKWEFLPSSVVAAEVQQWSSGEILVAIALADRSECRIALPGK